MADDRSSQATGDPNSNNSGHYNFTLRSESDSTLPSQSQQQSAMEANHTPILQPAVTFPSYVPPPQMSGSAAVVLPPAPSFPSFRSAPQFVQITNFQNPNLASGVPPPGVSSASAMASPGSLPPMSHYHMPPVQVPNPALIPFAHMHNGYAPMPGVALQGVMPSPASTRD